MRKQTPKMAKKIKKKPPRGRAYKKVLYSRRFKNIVKGVKAKSPNWHAGKPVEPKKKDKPVEPKNVEPKKK